MNGHLIGDGEIVRVAVEIERRGADFYRRTAKICPGEAMRALLGRLSADEDSHVCEFSRLCDALDGNDAPRSAETGALMSALAADVVFKDGLTGLAKAGLESQAAVLAHAIQSEKDSILFFTDMAGKVRTGAASAVFLKIAEEEKGHLAQLEDMLAGQTGKDEVK